MAAEFWPLAEDSLGKTAGTTEQIAVFIFPRLKRSPCGFCLRRSYNSRLRIEATMPSYTAPKGASQRGRGPHKLGEDDSVGTALRLPLAMVKAIDEIIARGKAPYRSRADFIRAAVEELLKASSTAAE